MKPSVIVEIGSARGRRDTRFRAAVSIDIDAEAATIRGDSHDPATLITLKRLLRDQAVDVLFIDGDHAYQGVRDDVSAPQPYGPNHSNPSYSSAIRCRPSSLVLGSRLTSAPLAMPSPTGVGSSVR
jgi:hypothetical protein